jgi:hypothetical protein
VFVCVLKFKVGKTDLIGQNLSADGQKNAVALEFACKDAIHGTCVVFCLPPKTSMSKFKLLSAIVFCSLLGGPAFAVDSLFVTDESDYIYGKGVHAFFDRNYEEAITILSKAGEIRDNDPRLYYFLGLAYLRQQKSEQAYQYFKKAAQLEYRGRVARDYMVSESLRRIQGEERLRLEKIRTEERANAQRREQRLWEMRYGSATTAAENNLRHPASPNPSHQTALGFGENAFGVKPMDPLNTAEENAVVRKASINPLGEITMKTSEVPEMPMPTVPQNEEPVVVRTARTFVNPDALPVRQETSGSQTTSNISPVRSAQSAAAKQIGRTLGTLFSKKAD